MSSATKQKHVFLESLNNLNLPTENQSIVKVKGPRGNNLHDVIAADGKEYIVSMPVKFRKSVWTKRGDFLIVESIDEGDKVKAEIIHILNKDHIRHIKANNLWPKEFLTAEDDVKENQSYVTKDMMPSSSEEEDYEEGDENDDNINERQTDEFESRNPNAQK